MSELFRLPYNASPSSKHGKLLRALESRKSAGRDHIGKKTQRFDELEKMVRAYIPESAQDARRKNKFKDGGEPAYYTIQIPYQYAELMTAHTYMVLTLLGRSPVFQYYGMHAESQMQEIAVESFISYQLSRGDNMVPLYLWLYDANKYGLGLVSNYWDEDFRYVSRIEESPREVDGIELPGTKRQRVTERVTNYIGNRLWNIRPHDAIPDPRVPISRLQDGEFFGWFDEISWSDLLMGKENGTFMNIEVLKDKIIKAAQKRDETFNDIPDPILDLEKQTVGFASIYTLFVKLVPKQWELGSSEHPEKWVFVVANNEVIIQARPFGEYHDNFPIFAIEPELEGYYEFSYSPLEIVEPMADVITWLFNSHFHNVRKSLHDMFVYDPMRVEVEDLEQSGPGKLIRAKPLAYGQGLRDAIQQFPVSDVTRSHIIDAREMLEMSQRTSGHSDSLMGLINQGGRKTATEVRQGNTLGTGRMRTTTEFAAMQGLTKLARTMVQTTQQFYDDEMVFRTVREMADEGQKFITVTPDMIAGSYDFLPVNASAQMDNAEMISLWKEILVQGGRNPEFVQQFDMTAILSHIAQLSGVRSVDRFKRQPQVQPQMGDPEQLEREADKGNLIPIGGNSGGRTAGGAR